jgi:hypothetical protein
MLGTGVLEDQPLHDIEPLPQSSIITQVPDTNDNSHSSASLTSRTPALVGAMLLLGGTLAMLF